MFAFCCVGPGLQADSSAKGLMADPNPWGSYQQGVSGSSQQSHGTWQPEPWDQQGQQEGAWQSPVAWQQLPGKGWSRAAQEEQQWQQEGAWQPPVARQQLPGEGWSGAAQDGTHVRPGNISPLWDPGRTSGMEDGMVQKDQRQQKQLDWVDKLQSELGKLEIHIPRNEIMEKFNQSLQAVVTSHSAISYMNRHRFTYRETPPCTSWKAGCFCPTKPDHEGVNEIGQQPAVDWAYHLAAVLRLMPTGKDRRAYLAAKQLIFADDRHSLTIFFNGMPVGMAVCFRHLLGTLTPPVILEAGSKSVYQAGKGGKMGRQENGSYHIQVAAQQGNGRSPQECIMQLVLAFHQRLADWPGPYSHTKCYPWVIGNLCKTGMHHPPLILIELAMGAWEMTAEVSLPKIEQSSLACKLGAMSRPGPDMTREALLHLREEVGRAMLEDLERAMQPQSWIGLVKKWQASVNERLPADRPGHWQTTPDRPDDRPDAAAADGGEMPPKEDAAALHIAQKQLAAQQDRIASQDGQLGAFMEQVLEAERSIKERDRKAMEERARAAEEAASTPSFDEEASALELLSLVKQAAGPQVDVQTLSITVEVLCRQMRANLGTADSASKAAGN